MTPSADAVTSQLADALRIAARAESLLVATDFDGVIAPLQPDPSAVRPTDGVMETLRALADRDGVHIAMVSGRDLATLRRLAGVTPDDPITLIGSHGAESSDPRVLSSMGSDGLSPSDTARLDAIEAKVREVVVTRHPKARVERKAAGVVVHTRGLADAVARPALEAALDLGTTLPGVRVLEGKSVVELSISQADKGTALLALSAELHPAARVYLGDDVTDEDVFTRFQDPCDVTVKVGPGPTAARYRIADTGAVATLLADLLASRTVRSRPN